MTYTTKKTPTIESIVREFEERFDPNTYTDSVGDKKVPPSQFLFDAIQPWLRQRLTELLQGIVDEAEMAGKCTVGEGEDVQKYWDAWGKGRDAVVAIIKAAQV